MSQALHHYSLIQHLLLALPPQATAGDRLVAAALASFASSDGRSIFPATEKLCRMTGMCKRAVLRAAARLKTWGFLADDGEYRYGKGANRWTRCRRIVTERLESDRADSDRADTSGVGTDESPRLLLDDHQDRPQIQGTTNGGARPRAAPRKQATRRRRSDAWEPGEKGEKYAFERGVDPGQEVTKFRNHHLAQGSVMADWDAAFRTWCDKARQFRAPMAASGGNKSQRQRADESNFLGAWAEQFGGAK